MIALAISLVLGALAISAALHALLSKRDSKSALAWVAFCLLLPLLG
ncbi:MAG: PLDc N-terminal domain-containing protein, partial [Proteobacteria bacterium]|nr:PLDc N-terminal domain-containing protein [Pseudomonadota bacterium]